MVAKYTANHSRSNGLGAYLKKDAGLQAAMLAVANEGKTYAESIAPFDTGVYAASFGVSSESGRSDSVGATLYNSAYHAPMVEYAAGFHTLAKTVDYLNAKK